MKAGNFLVAGALFCSLGLTTACSVAKDVKNANNMEKEGKSLAASINEEKSALVNEDVYLSLPSLAKSSRWESKTPEKRVELRARLNKMVLQLYRYLEIARHKNMRLPGGTGTAEAYQESAMTYINSLDKFEAKTQTYKKFEI